MCTLMMRLTSGMSSVTTSASLSTASSLMSSPSIMDNKHKMKEKINHALYPERKKESTKNILIAIESRERRRATYGDL